MQGGSIPPPFANVPRGTYLKQFKQLIQWNL